MERSGLVEMVSRLTVMVCLQAAELAKHRGSSTPVAINVGLVLYEELHVAGGFTVTPDDRERTRALIERQLQSLFPELSPATGRSLQ